VKTASESQATLAILDRSYVAWATIATAYAIAFLQRVSPQSVSLSFMADFHTDASSVAMLASRYFWGYTLGGVIYARSPRGRQSLLRPAGDEMRDQDSGMPGAWSPAASRSTWSTTSKRWRGSSLRNAFRSRRHSTASLDGAPSLLCSSAMNVGLFISHL
jgi:hypothetical protein